MELARRITVGLRSAPLLRIVEAKRRPEHGGIPKQPGLYAWWCDPTVVPGGAITTTHPEGLYELLYVGIAPGRANSKAELRGRLLRQHVGGNVGSSTFRFGLAALLWQRNGWMPGLSLGGKVKLCREHNRELSKWQQDNLRLSWFVLTEPWRGALEADVIAQMRPPMNQSHNSHHVFHKAMSDARKAFKLAALARGVC